MVHVLEPEEAALLHAEIVALERQGLVSRTFRRLDPDRQLGVVDAILQEAANGGPAAVQIKTVARRAGVAVGSLYQYFPDRDGMVRVAALISGRFLTASFDQYRPMLAALPLRDALSAYFAGGIEWSRMFTGLLRFFAHAAYHGDVGLEADLVTPVATAMRETVGAILTAAQARGELRDDVDLEWAIRLTNALVIVVGDAQLLPRLNSYFQVVPDEVRGEAATAAAIDYLAAALTRRDDHAG